VRCAQDPDAGAMPALDRLLADLDVFVGFARKRLGDPDLAADVVQDALARALAHQDDLRDEDRTSAWFYRILRNTIADVAERRRVNRARLVDLPEDEPAAPAETRAEVCACLGEAMRGLGPDHAESLTAVDLAGEAPAAAALRLGISETALKVRRHRARAALRERLQAICGACAAHGCVDCHCRRG